MRPLVATLLLLAASPVMAQESLDDLEPTAQAAKSATAGGGESLQETTTRIAEVNGYGSNRLQYSLIDPGVTPAPTADQPSLSDLIEANVQLKVRLGSKAFVYGDVSLLLQGGGLYYTSCVPSNSVQCDPNGFLGGRQRVDDHFVSSLQPLVATNELYALYSPAPWISLLAGKKRIVWGSGVAFNPTDLINPPKDPTDPNFQRAGSWMARVELPFEKFTVSLLASPAVLSTNHGLPSAILQYPGYDKNDDGQTHYILAARLYALILDSDINLFYYFSNKYADAFQNSSRFGLSFSRYFFTDYELHVDALFQFGSARTFVNHACVDPSNGPANGPLGGLGTPGCPTPNTAFANSKLDNGTFYPRLLVGARRQFSDESTLSLEYYYQADGFSDQEFEDSVRGVLLVRRAQAMGLNIGGSSSSGGGTVPQRFTFDPLRRHYLFISYSKPKIADDWTVSLVLIAGLRDLSGMISPTVSWNVREWLTLSLYGYVPIRGIPVGQVTVDNKSYSEYSLLPFDFRAMFEVRAFY